FDFYLDVMHPDDRMVVAKALRGTNKETEPFTLVYRVITLHGEMKWVHTRARLVADLSHTSGKIIGTMQDISEFKQMEESLRRKNDAMSMQYHMDRHMEKLKNIGSWQWNLRTGKFVWGENMYQLFGFMPHAFEPTLENFLGLVHPDDRERMRNELNS